MQTSPDRRTAFGGLLCRRVRWGLTLRGWFILVVGAVGLFILFAFEIHPFLSLNAALPTKTLVVEGWISEAGIRYAVRQICSGQYDHVFVTGGPISGFGGYTSDTNTYAHYGFSRLLNHDIPAAQLMPVPCRVMERDRTYSSAFMLREHFRTNSFRPASINLITDSVHARRSRLLFQRALGPDIQVGVIAVPPADYHAERWWRYSAGVKEVVGETIAYIYARIFFQPHDPR